MKTSISLEEAQATLLTLVRPVDQGQVPLLTATGRVLCRDIQSGVNLPAFSKSPLDGYALQAKDSEQAKPSQPVTLTVIEEVRAGYVPRHKVTAGTAIKVMTGAPVPEGADEIVKYEEVTREGNYIKIFSPVTPGKNVIRAGEDVIQGEMIAPGGMVVTPPLVGLLAAVGVAAVPVYEKVRIAILSTGDELVDPSRDLLPGKIYNSNLHSLGAYCLQLGTAPVDMGIVPDEAAVIADRISQALRLSDLVITTGGVSVGDYDVVPAALTQLGAELIFWKLDMKPGSPVIAASYNDKLIIGLSGNPAAALITFDLLVVPLIKKMMGLEKQFPSKISAILTENFNKSSQQRRFLRARVQRDKDLNYVKLTGEQSNGVLKSMIDCNALIDVPAGSGPLVAGQEVSAVVLGNDPGIFPQDTHFTA